MTVNTITPRIQGVPGARDRETVALRLQRAPRGVAITLPCGASHDKGYLAITCRFSLPAGPDDRFRGFRPGRAARPDQRIAKPS
ncbi:hypothetical protein GCM10010508_58080 [Streptomyces naganishii JCM 4654]|uniref:Uncharacterized protein n=1 Tax=Streptomyces naganishii JCM 4654 TaxID=1306179 RepID=A0A918Y965_9ACTN|nr:hypothetical protein GCM10010508_58080 [Streptomyces naganishii JCM 4654]